MTSESEIKNTMLVKELLTIRREVHEIKDELYIICGNLKPFPEQGTPHFIGLASSQASRLTEYGKKLEDIAERITTEIDWLSKDGEERTETTG